MASTTNFSSVLTRQEFLLAVPEALLAQSLVAGPARRKLLIVAAHPDDEYAFAATTYRLTHELGWIADHVVITNGEAGYRYSALAEAVYGVGLTGESEGRSRLPAIRKRETLAAGKVLGHTPPLFSGPARFRLCHRRRQRACLQLGPHGRAQLPASACCTASAMTPFSCCCPRRKPTAIIAPPPCWPWRPRQRYPKIAVPSCWGRIRQPIPPPPSFSAPCRAKR